jgi:hypothetical protein
MPDPGGDLLLRRALGRRGGGSSQIAAGVEPKSTKRRLAASSYNLSCNVMTKNRSHRRKTQKVVRMPATRFGHLQKQMKKRPDRGTPPAKS